MYFVMYKKLNKFCEEIIDFTLDMLKVSVNENFSTLLDFVFFGFLA